MVRRERVAERKTHVGEIAARAMQQDDRWARMARAELEHMQLSPTDVDHAARARVRALDALRSDGGGGEQKRKTGKTDQQHEHAGESASRQCLDQLHSYCVRNPVVVFAPLRV